MILSNTFNIVMAVFDVSQSVIARAAGIVQGSTDISGAMLADLEATLETLGLGSLLGLWLQSLLIHVTMWAINIVIFVIVYGRMIEIYLLTSLAPIPVATLSNRELGNTGQNYLKSLFAVGFQGLLILVCVAIYAVLIHGHRHKRRPHRRDMGLHGLFRAALLLPVQDWLHRPQRVQRTLKEVCVYRKIPHHLRRSAVALLCEESAGRGGKSLSHHEH